MSWINRLFGQKQPEQIVIIQKSSIPKTISRRNYTAAGSPQYMGDFRATSGSADTELINALERVRNKIRALCRNSSFGKRYLSLLRTNVVGVNGFTFQSRVRRGDGTLDRSLNDIVNTEWYQFCEDPALEGVIDMIELEKQMVMSWGRDGEFIIEIVYTAANNSGIAFNPVESDILDHTLNTIYPPTGNEIRMGVEIDSNRRRVAYHFLNQHPGDASWYSPRTRQRYRRVPADRVIHVFEQLRPGQTRGEPPLSSIPQIVKMLDGYREAEVTGRRVKAATMGFVTEGAEATAGGIDGLADREGGANHDDFEMDIEPGTIKKLPRGLDFKGFDPGGSQTDYAQFEGQIKTDVSMGANISPVSLGFETAKLSLSTHRGIISEDRDMYRMLQSFFIRMGMRKMFGAWLRRHSAVSLDTRIPPTRVAIILMSYKFHGRGWELFDPTKDTKAENEQLGARTTSLSRIAAKRGVPLEELLQEIADDEALLVQHGLTQSLGGGNAVETTSGGKNEDEDNDDEA